MDWSFGKGVKLRNIYFQKKISHLAAYTSGHAETVINYILVNCCYRNKVEDVKVISG